MKTSFPEIHCPWRQWILSSGHLKTPSSPNSTSVSLAGNNLIGDIPLAFQGAPLKHVDLRRYRFQDLSLFLSNPPSVGRPNPLTD
jgi:hypothetical protein